MQQKPNLAEVSLSFCRHADGTGGAIGSGYDEQTDTDYRCTLFIICFMHSERSAPIDYMIGHQVALLTNSASDFVFQKGPSPASATPTNRMLIVMTKKTKRFL